MSDVESQTNLQSKPSLATGPTLMHIFFVRSDRGSEKVPMRLREPVPFRP